MKKFVNVLLILVISMVIPITTVDAAKPKVDYDAVHNAEVIGWESSKGTNIDVLNIEGMAAGAAQSYKNYSDSVITVEFAGETYQAYCLDPQIPRPSGKMKCEPMNANPASSYITSRAFDENGFKDGYNHAKVLLAFRFLSVMQGTSFGGDDSALSVIKTALDYYVKLRDYSHENDAAVEYIRGVFQDAGLCGSGEGQVNCDSRYDMAKKLVKSSAGILDDDDILFDAYYLAKAAYSNGTYGSVADEDKQGSLTFEYWESFSHDNHVEYRLRSDGKINKEEIELVCDKCVKEPKLVWTGEFGWVELDIKPGECEYDVEVYYPIKGGYVCESTADGNYQSLFISIQEEVVGLAQILSGYSNSEECGGGCCKKGTKIKPDYIGGKVNNCCSATHSEASQYKLNDLFCEDTDLDLKYYWKKCGSEAYMHNEAPINDFCEVYCTERVAVDLPGAITAVSGRYFTLEKNPVGATTSSYITGAKRCRVWIDYDGFIKQYEQALKNEISTYNEVQRLRAVEKMYESTYPPPTNQGTIVISSVRADAEGSCEYECGQTCNEVCTGLGSSKVCEEKCEPKKCPEEHSGNASGTVTFYKWEFKLQLQGYYKVELDGSKHYNKYEALTVKHQVQAWQAHSQYSFYKYNEAKQKADDIMREAESECESKFTKCEASCSGSRNPIQYENTSHDRTHTEENVPEVYENLKTDISKAVDSYNVAARTGKELEEDLFTCTDFFESGNPGTNVSSMYNFKATQAFSYSQTYLNEKAELDQQILKVQFKSTPGCKVTGPVVGREGIGFDGEISEPQFTPTYSKTEATKYFELMTDFKESTVDEMKLQTNENGFKQFLDEEFEAEKQHTIDGKYNAVCQWEEDVNRFYTLAHSGLTERSSAANINKTIHERQYQIFLTTLEGTYETFWDISGLGTHKNGKGLFDDYFYAAGRTCANETTREVSMFTCMVKVEHEVVLTGYCNGVVNGTDGCDPFKEGYELVNFKIVDPTDLFPSVNDPAQVPSYNGQTYGYNWVVDPEGQAVLGAIQGDGARDKTYSPDNLSYSFKLAPSDMQLVKEYNAERTEFGGYADFTLNCECPSEVLPAKSTVSCNKCKSPFVENLANGRIELKNGGTQSVTGWSGRESLGTVRGKNNW